ncbi:MAG: DUF4345 family protein [Bacteroidales bacterium]|nr:DUF4345 family protein [Bacteroidales bacterium]
MEKKMNLTLLKVTLIIYAVIAIVYGLCYFFIPEKLVELSGGDPIPSPWIRWAGGVVISLGVGAILIFRNPAKQYVFVFTLALGTLLTGLALVYAWVCEIASEVWFTAMPAILMLVVSALFWWSLFQAKDVLCPKE